MQDNAPAHTSQVAMTAATECGFEILPHPPCSLIWLVCSKKLNSHLRGTQYGSNEGVIEAVNENLGGGGGQKNVFYCERIRKLEQRWTKYIALKGDYIEQNWSNVHSLVALSTIGPENFLIIPRISHWLTARSYHLNIAYMYASCTLFE